MKIYVLLVIAALILFVFLNLTVYLFPPVLIRVKKIFNNQFKGMSFLFFIFIRKDSEEYVVNHEIVHWKQQRRYTPIGAAFYLGIYYARSFIKKKSFIEAWRNNPLEKEANSRMWKKDENLKIWIIK